MRATVVSVSGFSSNTGKTGLICELLGLYRGWEAIKVSRGHYRSCGKNPEACCISPLLGDRPLVLSGRRETFAPAKDTGRYWDAGAGNVHWVVCTSEQVEEGVKAALGRVEGEGVFVEGTSLLKYVPVDFAIMVAGAGVRDLKSSAVAALKHVNAFYIAGRGQDAEALAEIEAKLIKRGARLPDVTVYFERDFERLAREIGVLHGSRLPAPLL
jgi:hypothetical protein